MAYDLTTELRASLAFVERNINLVKRYWGWEVVWLAYSMANALAVTYIGKGLAVITGQALGKDQVDHAILFLLIGTLVWHYLSVVFETVSDMISWERWEGTIEYTFMAPVRRFTHMIGTTLFSLVYGLAHTVLILAAVAMFFRLDLSGANFGGAALVLAAGSISFIGIGITGAVLPLLFPERGTQMTHVIQAVILLVSGVYAPIQVLPGWMQMLSHLSPATYVLQGMRAALLDGAAVGVLVRQVGLLVLMGVVAIPVGMWVFGLGERHAKRAGKLKRSG
jgi:ABC-2 type transport system permease protein